MSRCFPYNPLARGAGSGALIEPIKLQKKEKAEEKKERKREKKKQKKLLAEPNGRNTKSADQCQEWKHSVRNQLDKKSNQCPKAYEDESEQLDKSGLTEEHDLVYVPCTQGQDSPNSSRSSKKQKLDVPEPSRVGHGGRVVRIRIPTIKRTEQEQPKPRELLLPTPVPIPKPKQPEQPKPREPIPSTPVPIAKLKPLDQLNPTELLLPTSVPVLIGKRKQPEQSKPRELPPAVTTAMPKRTEQSKPRELSTCVPTAMPERWEQPKHMELAFPVPTTGPKKPEQSGPRELLLRTLVPATAKPKEPEQPRPIEQPSPARLPTGFAEPPCFSGRMESAAVQDEHLRRVVDALPVENHGESDAASLPGLGRDSKGFCGSKRSRRKAEKCENLFSSWNPPALVPLLSAAGDDEDWLLGSKGRQLEREKKRCRDESEPHCIDASALSSAWPPRACSLQGTDLYGLPYVVPF